MSYKDKIKSLFFLFSLFFTGLFLISTNALAVETNEVWHYNPPQGVGLYMTGFYYDGNGYLTYKIDFPSGASLTYDALYFDFESYDNNFSFMPYPNQSVYGQTYAFDCTSPEYHLDPWGNPKRYCKLARGTELSLRPKRLIYNGTTLDASGVALTKTEIDNTFGSGFMENSKILSSFREAVLDGGTNRVNGIDSLYLYHYSIGGTQIFFPLGSSAVNGVCGSSNGGSFIDTPTENLCTAGQNTEVQDDGETYLWVCQGSGGGSNDYCSATVLIPEATCGTDNGQTVETLTNFCTYGNLIFPSLVETITGWTWTCQQGSTYDYCSATRGTPPPVIPEQEDCSALTVPDKWFCMISNAVQGAFLPTPSKLNQLNTTVNLIGQKFPFNYINSAKDSIETIVITESLPTITLMGNQGTINLNSVNGLAENLRNATSILIIFMFVFWLIGYIKNFFR